MKLPNTPSPDIALGNKVGLNDQDAEKKDLVTFRRCLISVLKQVNKRLGPHVSSCDKCGK